MRPPKLAKKAYAPPAPPGRYKAIVQGVNSGNGVEIVEVFYDLDTTRESLLTNVSRRGLVRTGDNVVIRGFIVVTQATRVITRAIGPIPDLVRRA
jgi:hypothetical protein